MHGTPTQPCSVCPTAPCVSRPLFLPHASSCSFCACVRRLCHPGGCAGRGCPRLPGQVRQQLLSGCDFFRGSKQQQQKRRAAARCGPLDVGRAQSAARRAPASGRRAGPRARRLRSSTSVLMFLWGRPRAGPGGAGGPIPGRPSSPAVVLCRDGLPPCSAQRSLSWRTWASSANRRPPSACLGAAPRPGARAHLVHSCRLLWRSTPSPGVNGNEPCAGTWGLGGKSEPRGDCKGALLLPV
jgi:hypothetical protein